MGRTGMEPRGFPSCRASQRDVGGKSGLPCRQPAKTGARVRAGEQHLLSLSPLAMTMLADFLPAFTGTGMRCGRSICKAQQAKMRLAPRASYEPDIKRGTEPVLRQSAGSESPNATGR